MITLSQNYGRLFDSVENAQRAIELFPEQFPAGFRYYIETVVKTPDRGKTAIMMAAVYACDEDGTFLGYVARGEA